MAYNKADLVSDLIGAAILLFIYIVSQPLLSYARRHGLARPLSSGIAVLIAAPLALYGLVAYGFFLLEDQSGTMSIAVRLTRIATSLIFFGFLRRFCPPCRCDGKEKAKTQ
eukprot:TRINITY_DN23371_c0_g3_i1.p1 TRINITY_DN23371_c0_g3~~TRINITY_DN23371_c0_g3_i1.p1  ORF type:complete len:111 (+),score=10.22 TRINITY_DN23371_c0_g3_i1:95-427(+)